MRSLRVTVVIHVKKDVDTAPALSQAVQVGRRSATAVHFHEVALFEQEDGRIDHSFELRRQWVCKVQACPYGLSSSCSRGSADEDGAFVDAGGMFRCRCDIFLID
jgi:hypothetical protein